MILLDLFFEFLNNIFNFKIYGISLYMYLMTFTSIMFVFLIIKAISNNKK